MTRPVDRGPGRCPSCGKKYGQDEARCYPGIPAVRTKSGRGISARCDRDGTLAVPPAMPSDIRGVVREFRAAGAAWEVVDAWLRRFGLVRDPADAPRAARGVWPPRPPESGTGGPGGGRPGPRPPRKETARPFTYGGHEPGEPSSEGRGCAESVSGHGEPDREGRCPWCKRKIGRALPAPDRVPPTTQGQEYRRHYDPDWGSDHRDV